MQQLQPKISWWRQVLWLFFLTLGLFGLQLGELDSLIRDTTATVLRPATQTVISWERIQTRIQNMVLILQEGSRRLAKSEYEVAQLQVEADKMALLEKENILLRDALGQQPENDNTQIFQFYGSGEAWFINGGEQSGVEAGDIVTWKGSLVGVVSEAYGQHSRVRTLMDQSWQVPVQVGTASAKALLSQAHGFPEILLIPKNAPVQVEDVISTAGDETLPPSLPIGRIESLQDQPDGATRKATLRLYQSPRNIKLVEVRQHQ